MSLFSSLFGSRPSLDSVTFDASRYVPQGDSDGTRVWFLPDGGGVRLCFFPLQPDLPKSASSIGQLKDFYSAQLGGNLQLLECSVLPMDGVPGIRTIIKGFREESRGTIYLGSLTIPFRDFSFVIKIQCQEGEITGMREALLVAEAFQKGTGHLEGDRFVPHGWSFDDEQFDDRVPGHPLSRLRQELRRITASLRLVPKIAQKPPFALPLCEV